MSPAAPGSNIQLHLKQIDLDSASDVAREVFAATVGGYTLDVDETERKASELSDLLAGAEVVVDPTQPRRFAGDRTLSRTRYHALVRNDLDSDEGTVLREVRAYLGRYPGLVSLLDTTGLNTMELLGILADVPGDNYRALDLSQPSLLIAVRPLAEDRVLHNIYGTGRHYVVQVPFRLSVRSVRNVIDLRTPAAQSWLADRFNSDLEIGDHRFPTLLGRNPPDFSTLLPSLLEQSLGSGWTTAHQAGFFARQSGATGLIYPAARSNSSVGVENGTVVVWSGWCFVSYEGAPAMEMTSVLNRSGDEWPKVPGFEPTSVSWITEYIPVRGAAVDYEQSGPRAGGFEVTGVAEYNTARYRLKQVTNVLNAIADDSSAECATRFWEMALYSNAADLSQLALTMRSALLGHEASIAILKDRQAAAGSDYEAEALGEVRELLRRVPESFRASGAFAQAWGLA